MTHPLFVRAADVAALLEFPCAAAFNARRRALERLGFPRPVPIFGAPLRWRRDQVIAWRDNVGSGLAQPVPAQPCVNERAGATLHLIRAARTR